MPRPGTTVVIAEALPPAAAPTATDVAFLLGEAQRGPTDIPALVRSPQNFRERFGDRIPESRLSDDVDGFFGEGGSRAYVLRLVDATAAAAAATQEGITITAVDPGTWGDEIEVELVAAAVARAQLLEPAPAPRLLLADDEKPAKPARKPPVAGGAVDDDDDEFALTVTYRGVVVERAVALQTAGDLIAWAGRSNYIRARASNEAAPLKAATYELAGGKDGTLPVVSPQLLLEAALRFDVALGPGQLAAGGKTTPAQHEALLKAAEPANRVTYLDGPPTADVAALAAHRQALIDVAPEARIGGLWAQRARIPGLAPGTTRLASWSAIQAGLSARADQGGNPNQAAAGSFGICRYATGLEREFSDVEREALMHAGVNTAKIVYGRPRGYGFRTLVDENGEQRDWLFLNNSRLAMAIKARADAIAETYLFISIDGKGILFSALRGELGGMCAEYWPDGLYGETLEDAYRVDTGEAVNTPETIAAGEIRAMIGLHMAPPAEWVYIPIVKVPITEPLT